MKNAANETQIKEAAEREKSERERELNDIRFLLANPEGRRFLWKTLKFCKAFGSIWEPSAKIHYNAGVQDVGHYLMAEIASANEDAFVMMMKENKGDM